MKITEESGKAKAFLVKNTSRLPIALPGVFFNVVEKKDRLVIMLEADDDATFDQIRDSISTFLAWRNELLSVQGPDLRGKSGVKEFLFNLRTQGNSDSRIAEIINIQVEALLYDYMESENVKSQRDHAPSFYGADSEFKLFGLQDAHHILTSLFTHSKKIKMMEELLFEGLRRIEKGERPFEKDYPLSGDEVCGVLRRWQKDEKHLIINKINGGGENT